MTSSNSLLKQMLAAYRSRKRIQALLLGLAMLVSMLTMVSLKYSGVAVTLDDAEPVFGESTVNEIMQQEESAGDPASAAETEAEAPPVDPGAEDADSLTGSEADSAGTEMAPTAEIAKETASAEGADTAVDETTEAAQSVDADDEDNQETDDGQTAEQDAEDRIDMPAVSFEGAIGDLIVRAEAPEGAFPAGTSMKLSPVEDEGVLDSIRGAVAEQVLQVCAVDISFYDADGNEIEPLLPIHVEIFSAAEARDSDRTVVHLDNEGEASVVEQDGNNVRENGAVQFTADSFSIYAIVYTTIEKTVLASDGHNYHISVTCGDDAGVPANAELSVEEILDDTPEYQDYAAKAENAMGWEEGSASYLRLFDIKIVDAEGEKVEITAPVDVVIELADFDSSKDTVVLHFADDAEEPDVVQNVDMAGETLSFEADGFSAYAIVSGPEAIPANRAMSPQCLPISSTMVTMPWAEDVSLRFPMALMAVLTAVSKPMV